MSEDELKRLRIAVDMYHRIFNDSENERKRLREAIARHRTEYLGGSIPARDRELWAVLDA